jgi:hypothetical protein
LVKGKYPLHDVWMRLVDVPKFRESMAKAQQPLSIAQVMSAGASIFTIGNLPAEAQRPLLDTNFDDKADKFYQVQFGAMNGNWNESYRLKRINGQWREAIKVSDALPMGKVGKLRFSRIDPEYPKINGEVDWEK